MTCKAEISRSGFSGVKHLMPHPRIEFHNSDLEDPDWKWVADMVDFMLNDERMHRLGAAAVLLFL